MMKRVIAILAVSAIVTTAVYAQAAVAGTVETRFSVLRGNLSDSDDNLYMGGFAGGAGAGSIGAAWLQLSGTNADGTLGGLWRFRNTDTVRGTDGWFHRAFVWWRPVDVFRLWLGVDQDGMFDTAHFAGWGFHQGDNDYMFNHHWDFWRRIFPGNWDSFGVALSFMNIVDGLNVNLVLPTGQRNWPQATSAGVTRPITVQQMLAGFRLHSTFAIPGTGTLQFVYNAPGGIMNIDAGNLNQHQPEWGGEGELEPNNFGQLGLSFLLTALDFGNILFGGAMIIPDEVHDLDLHLGAALDIPSATLGDLFALRFRLGAHVLNRNPAIDDGFLTTNIMPIFALGPGSLMLDLSMSMALPDGDFDAEQHLGWSIKPVYRLPLASGAFSIGLHIHSGLHERGGVARGALDGNQGLGPGNNDILIHIPMLLRFSF